MRVKNESKKELRFFSILLLKIKSGLNMQEAYSLLLFLVLCSVYALVFSLLGFFAGFGGFAFYGNKTANNVNDGNKNDQDCGRGPRESCAVRKADAKNQGENKCEIAKQFAKKAVYFAATKQQIGKYNNKRKRIEKKHRNDRHSRIGIILNQHNK